MAPPGEAEAGPTFETVRAGAALTVVSAEACCGSVSAESMVTTLWMVLLVEPNTEATVPLTVMVAEAPASSEAMAQLAVPEVTLHEPVSEDAPERVTPLGDGSLMVTPVAAVLPALETVIA